MQTPNLKYTSKTGKWDITLLTNSQGDTYINVKEKQNRITHIHFIKVHFVKENDLFWDGSIAIKDDIILEISPDLKRKLPKYIKKEIFKLIQKFQTLKTTYCEGCNEIIYLPYHEDLTEGWLCNNCTDIISDDPLK